jgi:thymidine kinase
MHMRESTTGYLEIIYGPMKSGKTSRLLQLYKQFKFCEIPVMVINHCKDTVHSDTQLSSHDKIMIPCIQANKLTDLINFSQEHDKEQEQQQQQEQQQEHDKEQEQQHRQFTNAKVILINEAQFFDDIVPWVTTAVEKYKKNVYICGLNSDFKRQPFGNWLDLQQICDKVTHLHSWCGVCKKQQALFSHRLSGETDKIVIGADNYSPVCRTCWLDLNILL